MIFPLFFRLFQVVEGGGGVSKFGKYHTACKRVLSQAAYVIGKNQCMYVANGQL